MFSKKQMKTTNLDQNDHEPEPETVQLLTQVQPTFGPKRFSLQLQTGYNSFHALVYIFGVFLTISIFVFLNSTQGFVLKDILKINTGELGDVSGTLVFYDELTSFFVVAIWGILSDFVGKYLVFGFGFIILSLALGMFTFANNVYPELLLLRLLYSIGGAASSAMLTGILADIAFEQDKSKFAGLVGLSSGLGALLGVFVFLPLPTRFDDAVRGLQTTYLIVAAVAIFGALLMFTSWITLYRKSAHVNTTQNEVVPTSNNQPRITKFIKKAKEGLLAAKNPNIFLGYAGNFLARSDSVSITLFLPLWVYRFYLDNNLCGIFDINDPNQGKESCRDAYVRASILSGVTQVFALVGAPIFGT